MPNGKTEKAARALEKVCERRKKHMHWRDDFTAPFRTLDTVWLSAVDVRRCTSHGFTPPTWLATATTATAVLMLPLESQSVNL